MPSDFAVLEFDQTIGMSGQEQTREVEFSIDGQLASGAYLTVRVQDLQSVNPPIELLINGHSISSERFDPAGSDRYQTLFYTLKDGVLTTGTNRMAVRRAFHGPESADSLEVLEAVVHWRIR